jgi:hypothetical protein
MKHIYNIKLKMSKSLPISAHMLRRIQRNVMLHLQNMPSDTGGGNTEEDIVK